MYKLKRMPDQVKELQQRLKKLKIKMKQCVCVRCGKTVVARKLFRHQTSERCTLIYALLDPRFM